MTWQTVTARSPGGRAMDFVWRDKVQAKAEARLWAKYGALVVRPGLTLHGREIALVHATPKTPVKEVIVEFVDGKTAPLHLLGDAQRVKGQLCLVEPRGKQ